MECIKYVLEQFDIDSFNLFNDNTYEVIYDTDNVFYIKDLGKTGKVSKHSTFNDCRNFDNAKELTITLLSHIELSLKPEIYEQMKIKKDLSDSNNINHLLTTLFELPVRFTGKKNKIDIMLNNKRIGEIGKNKELEISLIIPYIGEIWFNKIEQIIGYLMVNSKIINDYSLQY